MEITSEEQNKVNNEKSWGQSQRPPGPYQMHQNSNYRGPRRRIRGKERVWKNLCRDYSWKFPQNGKGKSQLSPRDTKSPIQDKSKEKHANIHINQMNKD